MQYRRFPRIDDLEVSALGFGCMRLPTVGGDEAAIDASAFDAMLAAAEEAGINYLDTAYVYHRQRARSPSARRWSARASAAVPARHQVPRVDGQGQGGLGPLPRRAARAAQDRPYRLLSLHALGRERWAKVKELGASPGPRARQGRRARSGTSASPSTTPWTRSRR